jgi:hypothetical protein
MARMMFGRLCLPGGELPQVDTNFIDRLHACRMNKKDNDMKRVTRSLLTVAVLASVFLLVGSVSWADVSCSNTFDTPIVGGTISDNVNVQGPGVVCYIQGVVVTGNVHVTNGAEFIADACLACGAGGAPMGSLIMGNVQAQNCAAVYLLAGTTVDGNYQASNCTGIYSGPQVATGLGFNGWAGTLAGTEIVIRGNVQISNSSNPPYGLTVDHGIIGGDAQIQNNTLSLYLAAVLIGGQLQLQNNVLISSAVLSGNIVIKNLQCQNNVPAPTDGGSNFFIGNQQDQCAPGVDGFGNGF